MVSADKVMLSILYIVFLKMLRFPLVLEEEEAFNSLYCIRQDSPTRGGGSTWLLSILYIVFLTQPQTTHRCVFYFQFFILYSVKSGIDYFKDAWLKLSILYIVFIMVEATRIRNTTIQQLSILYIVFY